MTSDKGHDEGHSSSSVWRVKSQLLLVVATITTRSHASEVRRHHWRFGWWSFGRFSGQHQVWMSEQYWGGTKYRAYDIWGVSFIRWRERERGRKGQCERKRRQASVDASKRRLQVTAQHEPMRVTANSASTTAIRSAQDELERKEWTGGGRGRSFAPLIETHFDQYKCAPFNFINFYFLSINAWHFTAAPFHNYVAANANNTNLKEGVKSESDTEGGRERWGGDLDSVFETTKG